MSDVFAAIEAGDEATAVAFLRAEPRLAHVPGPGGATPVLHAMYRGQGTLARALAAEVAELDLADAAAIDATDRVRELLAADLDVVDGRTPDGFTPLQLAAFFGAPGAAGLLIEAGADVNAVANNPMRIQPLHAAAAGRHGDIAKLLIGAGADVNGRQQHDFTPLHAAAQNGDTDLLDALLAAGADPAATTDDGRVAATLAEAAGHESIAARLAAR